MKKLIALIASAMLIIAVFAGCGEDNAGSNMVSDAEQAVTDAVDGAAEAVTDAVNGAASAVTDAVDGESNEATDTDESPEQDAKENGRMAGGLSERTEYDEEASDGFVTDGDGIIGNGGSDNNGNPVISESDGSDSQNSSYDADRQSPTDSLM